MNSFYSEEELKNLGIKFGKNCLISRKASFYGDISIGDNVRIDDFCILSGKIKIGSYVHISAYCVFYGSEGIEIEDYVGVSTRCTILTLSGDFSGNYLAGSMCPKEMRNDTGGKVKIGNYCAIGVSSVILPNLTIEEGVAVGSLSLVNKTLDKWGIYVGIPVKRIKERSKKLLDLL